MLGQTIWAARSLSVMVVRTESAHRLASDSTAARDLPVACAAADDIGTASGQSVAIATNMAAVRWVGVVASLDCMKSKVIAGKVVGKDHRPLWDSCNRWRRFGHMQPHIPRPSRRRSRHFRYFRRFLLFNWPIC